MCSATIAVQLTAKDCAGSCLAAMAAEKLSPDGRQDRQYVLSGTLRHVGRWGLYWWRGSPRGALVAEPPTTKLLAEYDDGIACTVWLVRMLDVDAEVDIPWTGLGDRRKYTCNINALRLTGFHTRRSGVFQDYPAGKDYFLKMFR